MAVDADGVFHAMWVDNRTGVSQLWTAPITVRGSVRKHGAGDLTELTDITDKVTLEARSQESSEMWISPSAPPMSTKAP